VSSGQRTVIRKCMAAEIFDHPRGPGLIAEYAAECGNALIGKPAPRKDMYQNLEASGLGQCFAAYEDEQLVGFAMVLVCVVPHFGLALANAESLFVTREASCGGQLMRTLDDYATDRGCVTIFYTAPVGSRLARLLFLCADQYTNTNHVFAKRLG
jgi:hypothetical protein